MIPDRTAQPAGNRRRCGVARNLPLLSAHQERHHDGAAAVAPGLDVEEAGGLQVCNIALIGVVSRILKQRTDLEQRQSCNPPDAGVMPIRYEWHPI